MQLLVLLGLAVLPGCRAARGYAEASPEELKALPAEAERWSVAQQGAFLVLYSDFGTLTTDNLQTTALPWKLVEALADVAPEHFYGQPARRWQSTPGQPLRRFGFVYDAKVVGPPVMQKVEGFRDVPVGYAHGLAQRSLPSVTLELVSTNCSVCHLGRTWDAEGNPTNELWWGVPNHSLDFDGLAAAVVAAMQDARATDEALLAAMKKRHPQLLEAEHETYRKYVLPKFREGLKRSVAKWGGVHAWRFGGPGFSHGPALMREQFADDREALTPQDFTPAYMKIPNVSEAWQKQWLLIDGSYDTKVAKDQDDRLRRYLVGFLPVFGASVEKSVELEPEVKKVVQFLKQAPLPKFPGPVDAEKASRGAAVYADRCAGCHGNRGEDGAYHYPNKKIALEKIGTDPNRLKAVEQKYVDRFNATAIGEYMQLELTGAYMPPALAGVWSQAPYLHNGSVPTLWHLLTPAERPARFWAGGHKLDLVKVGVLGAPNERGEYDYPADYVPWSEPKLYDTSESGKSNAGHERQVKGLTDAQKWDVIEYLKTL